MTDLKAALSPAHAHGLFLNVVKAEGRNQAGEAAAALLNFLLPQLDTLRELANGYPRNPIDGSVWSDGKTLAELCDELTTVLAARELPQQEELASRLAAGMALQVMSHYPEEIFPRIVRNARCREALGQEEAAVRSYEAVLGDFYRLELLELLDDGVALDEASRGIVAALSTAVARLAELRPARRPTLRALGALLTQCLERDPTGSGSE